MANFTLEGHEKGVNCLDYYTGGDKPYLVTGSDDKYDSHSLFPFFFFLLFSLFSFFFFPHLLFFLIFFIFSLIGW